MINENVGVDMHKRLREKTDLKGTTARFGIATTKHVEIKWDVPHVILSVGVIQLRVPPQAGQ